MCVCVKEREEDDRCCRNYALHTDTKCRSALSAMCCASEPRLAKEMKKPHEREREIANKMAREKERER